MTDWRPQLADELRACGITPPATLNVGKFQTCDSVNGKKKAWVKVMFEDGDFAVAVFGDYKLGTSEKWIAKTKSRGLSDEEKRTRQQRIDEARAKQEAELRAMHDECAAACEKLWEQGKPFAHTAYSQRKAIAPECVLDSARVDESGVLMVKVARDNKIVGLQFIDDDGDKKFKKGTEKKGASCSIRAKGDGLETLLLCEGWATGVTLRKCMNLPVVVAFDAGNLEPVLGRIRAKLPKARVIICADNDCATEKNTGVTSAYNAATKHGAIVAIPELKKDGQLVPVDFNDLAAASGEQAVRDCIAQTIAKYEKDLLPPELTQPDPGQYVPNIGDFERVVDPEEMVFDESNGDFGLNMTVLGYNEGQFYYFPHSARQIVALTAVAHSMNNLLQLDTLTNWQRVFGGTFKDTSMNKIATIAADALMQRARERGVFYEEQRVRGCGAWIDEGRAVLHCGNELYVDGQPVRFEDFESQYTYVAAPRLLDPATDPLDTARAHALRTICESITWENKLSGTLLSGWLVIAPVCSALEYRPHIFITGGAESGKSTILNRIIKPILGKMALCFDGGTTEAALRDATRHDARPLVFDEAEPSMSMDGVIALARLASTGATVKKFGQKPFVARFAACFSAINPPIDKASDESRISFMVVRKNTRHTASAEYQELMRTIRATITKDYGSRLLARTMANMGALLDNIETFKDAVRLVTGGARAAELVGTMLAGVYLLHSTDRITPEAAEEWVSKHDWRDHTNIAGQLDPERLLQHIAGQMVDVRVGVRQAVGELVAKAGFEGCQDSNKALRPYGIMVKEGRVYFAGAIDPLKKLLRNTDWEKRYSQILAQIEGAIRHQTMYFAPGIRTYGISIPLSFFEADVSGHTYSFFGGQDHATA